MTDTLFAPERIETAVSTFRAFWRAESAEPLVSVYTDLEYRQETDPDRMVEQACRCIRADAASGRPEIVPCFWPDFGTISTAAMWGGKVIPPEGERCIHIEPVARSVDDLGELEPRPFEETDFQKALDLWRRVCDRLESDRIFVRLPDFQGPMNTLALMMDQTELMCALFESPDEIHAALDHVTDTLIDRVRRFLDEAGPQRVAGMIWPHLTLPGDMGVCITQDYMPLLSPDLYAHFEIPRLKRIADAFGGVWIHCCGKYAQHLPTLKNGGFKIWGLESSYPQTPVWDVWEVFGNDIAYLVGVSPDGESEYPTIIDYARDIARRDCAQARFWFCACESWCDTEELRGVVKDNFGAARPG